jgi:hypothetical protein
VIPRDDALAEKMLGMDQDLYEIIVTGMATGLIDRETVPGVDPADAMQSACPTLIIAGDDAAHARSAAHVLHECLRNSTLCDLPVPEQSEDTVNALALRFLSERNG